MIMNLTTLTEYAREWQRITNIGITEIHFYHNDLAIYCTGELAVLRLFLLLGKCEGAQVRKTGQQDVMNGQDEWEFTCKWNPYKASSQLKWTPAMGYGRN